MDTRVLKTFQMIARHGSLAVASQMLHLTPSALSHALKALESELGCRVFDRVGNRLVLNQAGEHLLSCIEQPLAAIDEAAISVKALGSWGHGQLRIGASIAALQHIIPGAVRELRREFSKLRLRVESGDSPELIQMLQEHRIDVMIGPEPGPTHGVIFRQLFEDELLFAVSADHPWTDGRSLSREDIRREPLIFYHQKSLTSQWIRSYFNGLDIEPFSTMEIGSLTAIREMIRLNLGVSVLPPWVLDPELRNGSIKMRSLGARALKRTWSVGHLTQKKLTLAEERFCQLCSTQTKGMLLTRKDLPEEGRILLGGAKASGE